MTDTGGGTEQGVFPGMPEPLWGGSPSKLLAFLDCPRRYRMTYLDVPRPTPRHQRAHTSVGIAVHNALRDVWDLDAPTPQEGGRLLERAWIDVGFRDAAQSARWRARMRDAVVTYLERFGPPVRPIGIERTVSLLSDDLRLQGRVDRLDDRGGELVVVDYKTSRTVPTDDDARTSLPLALYAAAVWKMLRRPVSRVELHHVPSGTVVGHDHTGESIRRHVERARSIMHDARTADADHAAHGTASEMFPPVTGPLCGWCDLRAHCPEGQAAGPEKSDWAALGED
ncbi:PD-(D/E)XK nuclease family protein [Phycicoccus sp. BSK3Z-2]|uniref:PD-(D/E)XK nuclease family protein n=1 Tax=Phycicoccus avicenniae TaxID=2828860 RepID=A0A941I191_9MICO|nr:PD-(D/E)XK nuclease family protein [Phycicoccus avicenniae]MBR7743839.1 PD-(D/E)XK nuclease family protein [Phycicoccus avicenniae]